MKEKNKEPSCMRKTSIGGQALMEGIMMRGPEKSAMAVRNPQGEIVLEEFETKGVKRPAICRWPVIRGLFGYIDSMTVGYKCLMRSAEIAGLEDMVEEKPKKDKKNKKKKGVEEAVADHPSNDASEIVSAQSEASAENIVENTAENEAVTAEKSEEKKDKDDEKLPAWVMTLTMVASVILGVGLAVGLFVVLPTFLFDLLAKAFPVLKNTGNDALNSLCKSAFEGVMKVLLLVGYMAAISLMKDIRRTFMFHGAEHKTIFCYESGLELTVENVRLQRRFHPRCGTSFLILMVLVSIFVSFFIDPISIWISGSVLPSVLRYVVKLLMLPIIVGLGYELIKFAGKHDNWLTRAISLPGVWLQHLTVLEPTDDMIECAITAMKEVIPNNDSDRW